MKVFDTSGVIVEQYTSDITIEIDVKKIDLTYIIVAHGCSVDIKLHSTMPGSKIDIRTITVSRETTKLHVNSYLAADETHAQLYMLSLVCDHGNIDVDGGVIIQKGISKAAGHLLEENIILGKKIAIKTIPKLDVWSNDVSASHGARIDTLNEELLFYMKSKGLSDADAKRLMISGYINKVFENIEGYEDLKNDLLHKAIHG